MASSRACSFCALPDPVRAEAIARWKNGERGTAVSRWLAEQGQSISARQVEYCLKQQKHDGPTPDKSAAIGKLAELLEANGVAPENIRRVKSVKINKWQGMYAEVVSCEACHGTGGTEDEVCKECDGKQTRRVPRVVDMEGAAIVLTPSWDDGPEWPVVQPARPCVIKPPATKSARTKKDAWKTCVILPDVQIGYRRSLDTAELDPFHDEHAMSVALQIVRAADPEQIVVLGDFLDFAEFGKFEQEAGFALTTQPSIDRAHQYLTEIFAAAPRASGVFLEGNHDRRLQKAIVTNAKSAFGIRPGNTPPETWPDLSVPHLLRFDELPIEYKGGYPAGIHWINQRLCAIHGHKVRSSGSTAAAVVDDMRVSVIFGHVHRVELQHRTRLAYEGGRSSLAASPGCLCRIDGTVPSVKGSTDPMGRPIETVENWQHGLAVVTYKDGDEPFHLELVPIHDGFAMFRGEAYGKAIA